MGITALHKQWVGSTSKMIFIVLSSVVAVALSVPDADADAFYGQYQWPATFGVGPYGGFSSTCFGCRPYRHLLGKRSAEPEPQLDSSSLRAAQLASSLVVPTNPFVRNPVVPTTARTSGGFSGYGKRSAEPHGVVGPVHGLGLGVASHPGYGTSFVGRKIYGYPSLRYGKRSADADAHYGAYGYGRLALRSPYGYGYRRGYFFG